MVTITKSCLIGIYSPENSEVYLIVLIKRNIYFYSYVYFFLLSLLGVKSLIKPILCDGYLSLLSVVNR